MQCTSKFFCELPMGIQSLFHNENARSAYGKEVTGTENASKTRYSHKQRKSGFLTVFDKKVDFPAM